MYAIFRALGKKRSRAEKARPNGPLAADGCGAGQQVTFDEVLLRRMARHQCRHPLVKGARS
jgi:hypothetical protein